MDRGWKVPCLMPIRVKPCQLQISFQGYNQWFLVWGEQTLKNMILKVSIGKLWNLVWAKKVRADHGMLGTVWYIIHTFEIMLVETGESWTWPIFNFWLDLSKLYLWEKSYKNRNFLFWMHLDLKPNSNDQDGPHHLRVVIVKVWVNTEQETSRKTDLMK